MKNIAIFASGEGSNAQNIIDHFKHSTRIKIALIVSNNDKANVLNRSKKENIPFLIIKKEAFYNSTEVLEQLRQMKIDFILLAGFLWLVPENLIAAFPGKIVNIHPALLPKYGGKGMYGMKVHEAVIAAKEKKSGITIHYVDNEYDKGKTIAQYTCKIDPLDTPEILAGKIHVLEKDFFPTTIDKIL